MKKIALSLLVALSCISAKAADGKSLFVSFNDGSKIEFALSTLPEVTFGDDKMTVKSTATTASYELWKVSTFTYGTTTGIQQQGKRLRTGWEEHQTLSYHSWRQDHHQSQ